MAKESHMTINKKIGPLVGFFKNLKFIAINIMVLVILTFAFISGDGKKILLSFYENITGQKFETFSPIEDYSGESYTILKYKLLERNIGIDNVDITIFKESDVLHKYRVVLNEEVLLYKVEKTSNGVWKINQIKP